MAFDFINPLMLVGLAGLALPVLAHLLSKRKYDVVDWGAMQFLELGHRARRKLRLEELLLLLLRMALIALLAVALARPWMSGGFLSHYISKQSRDVVLVIDGSYSMGWEGVAETPHAAAVQWTHEFLEDLESGDTVALLDARDQVRPVVQSPTRDLSVIRKQLSQLPAPAGSSNLVEAVAKAVQILSRTSNLSRDVVVLTDGQAKGWFANDENLWSRVDELRQQPAVLPNIWVVNVQDAMGADQANFSVDRLRLSRELTVAAFPVQIATKVHYSGGQTAVSRRVFLEVDSQRLSEKTISIQIQPGGEANVEFEYRFSSTGSHVVSVVLEDDKLPGDNRADAAVAVAEALPILLIDGTPDPDRTRSETFFAKAALSASSNNLPWIRANIVASDQLRSQDLSRVEVAVLANVSHLTDRQLGALKDFVSGGGGLVIALGDQIESDYYNSVLFKPLTGLFAGRLQRVGAESEKRLLDVTVVDTSLSLPWIHRFRHEKGGAFTEARFSRWWKFSANEAGTKVGNSDRRRPDGVRDVSDGVSESVVAARLDTGDPLLILQTFGRGHVALWTSSIDADWNTLPAKPDYVPFLHELIFHLASNRFARNVETGAPLLFPVAQDFAYDNYVFRGPGETEFPVEEAGDELHRVAQLSDTRLPGIYSLQKKVTVHGTNTISADLRGQAHFSATTSSTKDANARRKMSQTPARERLQKKNTTESEQNASLAHFVVEFDRQESDLTPLTDQDRESLERNGRMKFIKTHKELKQEMFTDDSQTEFWHILLLVFLVILVGEVVMTRRLVQGGHEAVSDGDRLATGKRSTHAAS